MWIWLYTLQVKSYAQFLQDEINEPPAFLFKEAQDEEPVLVTPIGGRH